MTRRIIKKGLVAMAAAIATVMAGCSNEDIVAPPAGADGKPYITLKIHTSGHTRATTSIYPEYEEHEKVMNSVDLFFYTSDAGDDTPATFVWHADKAEDGESIDVTIPLELVEDPVTGANALFGTDNKCKVYAIVNSTEAAAMTTALMEDDAATKPTVNDLRNLTVTTPTFANQKEFKEFVMFSNNDGGDEVTFNKDANSAEGNIYVKTLAAKIDLFVNFAETVQGNDENGTPHTWTVETDEGKPTAHVHIVNGVQSVRLGGWNWTNGPVPESTAYFDTRNEGTNHYRNLTGTTDAIKNGTTGSDGTARNNGVGNFEWMTDAPFYTYPNHWEITPLELHRTTLLLKVDWVSYDDGELTGEELTTYYTVPLNLETNEMEPNKYYRVKVNINTLGGMNFGAPVELEASLEVLEWGHAELEADIRETRYLEVQQQVVDRDGTTYTALMNNIETVTIPFFSSHKVKITRAEIKYMTYEDLDQTSGGFLTPQNGKVNAEGKTTTEIVTNYFEQSLKDLIDNDYQGAYIDELRSTITVHHATRPINNPNNANGHYEANYYNTEQYTYNSYYITIDLEHDDHPGYKKTITIKQNPPVYIEGEVNASFNNNEDRRGITYNLCGWVRVNSNSNNPNNSLGGIDPIGKGLFTGGLDLSSSNPVMYIVTATQLGPGSIYHVADPRSNLVNLNLGGNQELPNVEDLTRYSTWTSAPHIDGRTGQTLQYYYPTVESMTQEDMYAIAPRFRMASSFGKTSGTMNRETARRRCAAYQEYGYPAGRWRLPTLGEMGYVTELAKLGYIPPLFGGKLLWITIDGSYWTAQGLYEVNDDGELEPKNNGSGYVRCVYDDWYWVKVQPDGSLVPDNLTGTAMQTFTWGDKPKNNPQVQPEQQEEQQP